MENWSEKYHKNKFIFLTMLEYLSYYFESYENNMKIFLDIDDTLANTSGYVEKKYQHKAYHPNQSLWKRNFTLFKDYMVLRHVKKNPEFWKELPLLDHSHELVQYCREYCGEENLHILTALPFLFYKKETIDFELAQEAKKSWAKSHFPFIFDDNIHVVYAREKHLFISHQEDILIDDSSKNIYHWNRSGGKGILYQAHMGLKDIKKMIHHKNQ